MSCGARRVLLGIALLSVTKAHASGESPRTERVEEIVVVGERTALPPLLEPAVSEVEVLDRAEIEALPVTRLDEVLATTPGIRAQARVQGEEAAVSIEGLPPEYTKLLVDGQRYTGEIGGAADLRDVPTLFVRSVMIRRGPQGLRYGTDAAGGAVELDTLRGPAAEQRAGVVEAAGGDDGFWFGGLHLRGELGESRLALTAVHDQIDGFDPPQNSATNRAGGADSRRLSRDVYLTWDRAASSSIDLLADVGFRREDEDFVPVGGGETSRRDQSRWRGTLGARWRVGDETTLRGDLAYFQRDVGSAVGRAFTLGEHEWRAELGARREIDARVAQLSLELGLDGRAGALELDEGELPPELAGVGLMAGDVDEELRTIGFFAIGEARFGERVTFELGLREELSSEFDDPLVGQAGVLVTPFAKSERAWLRTLRLRASAGRSFRAPSLRDLYQPETPQLGGAYFLSGNPALEPERAYGFRAGLEWSPTGWLAFQSSAFQNEIDDGIRSVRSHTIAVPTGEYQEAPVLPDDRLLGLWRICRAIDWALPDCAPLIGVPMERVPLTRPSDVFVKTNLDSIRTRGVEAMLQLRPRGNLALDLAYTLLDTRVDDSKLSGLRVLPNQPKQQVDGRLRIELPLTATSVALIARYRGPAVTEASGTGLLSFANPKALSDPSCIASVRVTQPIGRRFELFLDLDNLTDERVQDSYAIRGRTLFGGVRLRLGGDARSNQEDTI